MDLYGSLISNGSIGGGGGGTTDVPIKSISVNGSVVAPINKNVNIDVPTKTSQLNNDSSFVTESDLTVKDYADKTYVGEKIAQSEHLKRKFVTVLPEPAEADEHTIYMLKDDSVQGDDKFKEYMLIDGVVQCVGDTSVDLTDYAKTADIPTELPANGGNANTVNNHTVETNVPADAVFTDTIYDDTEMKGSIDELNSNLDTLKLGDTVGGNNLVYKTIKKANIGPSGIIIPTTDDTDIHIAKVESGKTYTFTADSTFYALYSVEPYFNDKSYDSSRVTSGSRTIIIPSGVSYLAFRTSNTYATPMVNEGSISLQYEPYIKSVKMITDEIERYSIPLNIYMGVNRYLTIKMNVDSINYSFNISDSSGNIYNGVLLSYNGSLSVQIKKINSSSIKNGYIIGFRKSKVSDSEFYLVIKVSDYSFINGVINIPSFLKDNINIIPNDYPYFWDEGTDIVVKDVATTDEFDNYTKNIKIGKSEDVDANNLKDNANYIFPEDYTGITSNMPSIFEKRCGGVLECKSWGNCVTQLFYTYISDFSMIFTRSYLYMNGEYKWSSWIRLVKEDQIGSLSLYASGSTLSITDGTHTWTLEANN